ARLDPSELGPAIRELTDQGMILLGAETMIPAVADALLADLPAAERRRVHESVASALVAVGADPLTAASQLRAARAYVPASAAVFAAAAERLRFDDPAAALGWYDDATTAGADPASIAVGRAEVAVLLGLSTDAPTAASPDQATRAGIVAGAIEAHHGRCDRAAEALLAAGGPGPLLAVPSLVAVGDLTRAQSIDVSGVDAPVALRRLAEAALTAAARPAAAVPLFIEAAEALERTPPTIVLPDTAHALGAVLSSIVGDVASAEHLLERAITRGYGGPAFVARHRLLLAWVRMRGGRYDTALLELGHGPAGGTATAGGSLTASGTPTAAVSIFGPTREVVLRAALRAGIARRSGDIAALRDAWTGVEPALARRTVDIFSVEPLEELVVAASRLRQHRRVALVMEALDTILHRLGSPPDWAVVVGWIHLQVAIAGEDADAAARAADRIADACRSAGSPRQKAQCAAAGLWARVLAGDVDPDAATVVAGELAAVGLPWEGSRLVGQAAIRTTDAAAARRLLERARELSSAEVVPDRGRAESAHGGLSEREVEVARMVLAGDTYREIGAKLFISPKTVEHHVARIRAKVGATTRAEFVAALRTLLQSDLAN
ncbi:MAG: helix-turn-helix transcriptional regulator, partial [Dactylosporangium sp.]|nr:helix-turn-helix transcriptional regulator [Dactylosporangium sp.]